jgi:hypothetical protein
MKSSSLGMGGDLALRHIPAQRPHRAISVRLPGGRLLLTRDKGDSKLLGEHQFISNVRLMHRGADGVLKDVRDLGSGLVTNAGVNLMSYDLYWVPTYTKSALYSANFHAIGTGATAAASSDVFLQTAQGATNLSGTTNGYMTGTQSIIANATGSPYSPVYQTVATFTATGSIAVTEWIVAIGNGANITNSASNSATSSSLTDTTHTPFGASNAQAMWTVQTGVTTPSNTSPTTQPMLQVKSNSTTVLTGIDGSWGSGSVSWLSSTNQAVSTPSGTGSYVAFPTAWDHKVFSVVNLVNGDTLQVTYQLSVNSGG